MGKYFSALSSFCLALILLLGGCHASKQVSDRYLNYEDNETGWSTRYPSSWEMVADNDAASTEEHKELGVSVWLLIND